MANHVLRGVTALVGLTVLASLGACTPGGRPDPATPPATEVTAPPRPDFCEVTLPASWREAIRAGRITQHPGQRTHVIAAAPDGTSVFANIERADASRQLTWLQDGGRRRTVATMPDQFTFALWGSFDGRWLVYALTDLSRAAPHGGGGADLYAWDSTGDGPPSRLLDQSSAAAIPVVRNGRAAWTQHTGGREFELHLYSLPDRRDRIIARGRVTDAQFVGEDLLWYDRSDGRVRAVSAATGETVPPPPLPAMATTAGLATDGLTTAWVTENQQELNVWRAGWPQAVRILRVTRPSPRPVSSPRPVPPATDAFSTVQQPAVARDLVVFERELAWYAADLRTGGYVRLTRDHGHAVNAPGVLTLAPVSEDEETYAVLSLERLPPLPGCRP
ncbi:hypothetical protein [Micromonospora sp. NPDC049679]|uniref:hypothetical protein n=1 Tax=Micromonospora sp. NPDC049679 TaxID=3155920 RepID=UPI0033EBA1D9